MKNYIGLDAHSATSTLVNLDWQGNVISRCHIQTTESNLLGFLRSLKGEKKLTFEESNLSKWLYIVLKDEVDELIVCNPLFISKRSGPKNDYRDALHLADELRCNHITPVFHEDNELIYMRALISAYTDMVQEMTRTKNRYKCLFRSEALDTDGKTLYDDETRIKELSQPVDRFIAQNLMQQLIFLKDIKSKYREKLSSNMKKYKVLRNLDSIPGIDEVRAHTIAALICSPHRFKHKHKLWAYAMLVKYTDESDGASYGKKMVHGRTELKNVFLGAALSVLKGESGLRKYYDRLRSKGQNDRQARYNLARRISAICLSVMKNNREYIDRYEEEDTEIKKTSV